VGTGSIEARLQDTEKRFDALGEKIDKHFASEEGGFDIPIQKLLTDLKDIKTEYAAVTTELQALKEEQKAAMEHIFQEFHSVATSAESLQNSLNKS